jgi:hypothetical protein
MSDLEKELLAALKLAKSRVNDLQIIMNEAFEEFGVTFHMCGSTYDPKAIEALIARVEQKRGEL